MINYDGAMIIIQLCVTIKYDLLSLSLIIYKTTIKKLGFYTYTSLHRISGRAEHAYHM